MRRGGSGPNPYEGVDVIQLGPTAIRRHLKLIAFICGLSSILLMQITLADKLLSPIFLFLCVACFIGSLLLLFLLKINYSLDAILPTDQKKGRHAYDIS